MNKREQQKAETRQKLLDAARFIMQVQGRDRFNLNAVTSIAGVSPGLIYKYWPTKEDLVAEVLPPSLFDEIQAREAQLRELDKLTLEPAEKWMRAREILGL